MTTRRPEFPARAPLPAPGGIVLDPAVPVHRAIRRRATADPTALAVHDDDGAVTYGALVAAADALAAALHRRDVGPGNRVAVALTRPADRIVAQLAVVQAGAAYAPLDATRSDDRVQRRLADVAPAAVIGDDLDRLTRLTTYRRGLDQPPGALAVRAAPTDSTVDDYLRPDQPAQVAWTVDAAGTPTGVLVPHRAVAAVVAALVAAYRLGPGDRVLLTGPQLSTVDVFVALAAGATLVGPGVDPAEVGRYEATHVVTNRPGALPSGGLAGVDTVVVSGPARTGRPPGPRSGGPRILATYAPSVIGLPCAVTELSPHDGGTSLGVALPGVRLHVLDQELVRAPVATIGQLYVAGVARPLGYLNRPDLTAHRFRPDPFAPGLLVRTGVLAYWRRDGQLARLDRD